MTVLEVLIENGGVELGNKSTSLALHIQPKNIPFRELLQPFLAPALAQLENSQVHTMAYVVKWKGRRIMLDGSAAIANAIFVHLEREFEPTVSFDDMKQAIFNDEATILKLLNVEEITA